MKKDQLISLLTTYRRNLHRIPELGFELELTNRYITDILNPMSCRISAAAQTGVCAFFDFQKEDTIAFRSDMDALPIEEKTDLPFCSVNKGAMHACGHDGHMAMLLTLANVLEKYAKEGTPVKHNVLLIFQPAEETTGGAKIICETGILQKYNVKKIFGIHLWPYIGKGVLSSRSGPMMAKSSEINVDIKGKSAHCTAAEEGVDALFAGCQYLNRLYEMPEVTPDAPSILKFGKMVSGDVRNAISPYTRLEGTLRCLDLVTFDLIIAKMEEIAAALSEAYGCEITVGHSEGYPPVTNDPAVYREVFYALKDLNYQELAEPSMIAEDFSFYQLEVPGVFLYLGTGTDIPLHSAVFNFEEDIMLRGVEAYLRLLKI